MLDSLWLCELEKQLSLRVKEDRELEDELVEKLQGEELDMLKLILDLSLEHLLLEEHDEYSAQDKQELEELEKWELCEALQLKEQHEVKLSDTMIQEELIDWDLSEELLL